jgi:hypothetical protein
MTQLVGAICEDGKKLVLLSDRMVGRAGLTFERGSKGQRVSNNAMVLSAGTVHEPELIMEIKNEFQGKTNPAVLEIAKFTTNEYHKTRLARIVDEVLRARGFDSIGDFYQAHKLLHDSLVIDINSMIERYELGVYLLVAGVDSEAHIYFICDPGVYSSFDEIGFFCPGMGKEQAESTFVWYEFSPNLSLRETLYISFEAKKKAEAAGSVGSTTDAWIIDKEGIHEVQRHTIEELERIYAERQRAHQANRFGKEITDIELP